MIQLISILLTISVLVINMIYKLVATGDLAY